MKKAKKSPSARAKKRSSRKVDPVKSASDYLNTMVLVAAGEFGIRPTLEALGFVHGTALGTSVEQGNITKEQLYALVAQTVGLASTSEMTGVEVCTPIQIAKPESEKGGISSGPRTPERFGIAISGQCAKPLGEHQYCVRAKHHDKALRCSALEKHADTNIPEEAWEQLEQATLAEKGRIDPTSKTFFFLGLGEAVSYTEGLFEQGMTKPVIRSCLTTFQEDALASLNAELAKREDADLAHLLSRMRPNTRRQ